jgi:hypothetical protein
MCLIIYSKTGALPERADFMEGARDNPDGIGIMSADGIEKFLGKKAAKKAWRYAESLSRKGLPFGVHFRWATHGKVGTRNSHPFQVPGTGDYVMHNGILWTAKLATDQDSDTAIFCRDFLPHFGNRTNENWKASVLTSVGWGNKLLVMAQDGREFILVNESAGTWFNSDVWMSNTYSIVSTNEFKYAGYMYRAGDIDVKEWQTDAQTAAEAAEDLLAEQDYEDDFEADSEWFRYQKALEDGTFYQWREQQHARSLESAVKGRAFSRGTGFDWHDATTWDKYPIPGTEGRKRLALPAPSGPTLNTFGNNEVSESDPLTDADPMDGVQEYL